MTRYWVVALIVAFVGLLYIVRRVAKRLDADDERSTLVPHGDGERQLLASDPLVRAAAFDDDRHLDERDSDDQDDTAPSVLSPPEWTPPKSASNGSRR